MLVRYADALDRDARTGAFRKEVDLMLLVSTKRGVKVVMIGVSHIVLKSRVLSRERNSALARVALVPSSLFKYSIDEEHCLEMRSVEHNILIIIY